VYGTSDSKSIYEVRTLRVHGVHNEAEERSGLKRRKAMFDDPNVVMLGVRPEDDVRRLRVDIGDAIYCNICWRVRPFEVDVTGC